MQKYYENKDICGFKLNIKCAEIMQMFWIYVLTFLKLSLIVESSRLCGRPNVCKCLPSISEVNCVNRQLFDVPDFENEGWYDVLDLRRNHIKVLPSQIMDNFGIIDVRDNLEFKCEIFWKSFQNKAFPIVVSNCDETQRVPGMMKDRPTSTEFEEIKKYHTRSDVSVKTSDTSTVNSIKNTVNDITETWLLRPTSIYDWNMSTIKIFSNFTENGLIPKLNMKVNIYVLYASISSAVVVAILLSVFCGKRIIRKCRRRALRGPMHEILQEEEDTCFNMNDLTAIPSSLTSMERGFKQE